MMLESRAYVFLDGMNDTWVQGYVLLLTYLKFDDAWSRESLEYVFLDGVNEVVGKQETLIPRVYI